MKYQICLRIFFICPCPDALLRNTWKAKSWEETHTWSKGFSLVEVMAAILIFAILAGLTTLNFANTREIYKLRGATWEVASRLQATRMAAVKENSRYLFSVAGPTLHIHKDEDSDGVEDAGEPLTTRDLSSGSADVAFTASGVVTFTARGTTLAPVTITITDQSGHSKTVTVSRAGRISIS